MPAKSSSFGVGAASSVRQLSLRGTEDLLRRVSARVTEAPADLVRILDEYPDALLAFTPTRMIIGANAAAEQFFGYGRKELDGFSTNALVRADLRQPDAPPMKVYDTLTTVDLPGRRKDGSEPEVSWTFGTVVTQTGSIFVMVVRDRAEIDDALEALYASEQRFRLLVDGVRDHAVLLLDAEGRIASWNSGAERIKGWRAEEIIGQPYETFYPPEDRAAGVPAENLSTAVRDGFKQVSGWRVRKDGTRFYAEASLWPLFAPDGALQGYAKITHDLTSKRAAAEAERRLELERAAREAAEAGRDRLARLHRIAQSLSRATSPSEVAAAVLDECCAEVGADGGAVLMLSRDGRVLTLVEQHGHPASVAEDFASVAVESTSPAGDAIRTRMPLFFESAAAGVERYPQVAARFRNGGFEALATLPLLARGAALGVLVIRYRERHEFSEADRSLLLTTAAMCGQALERARLFDGEKQARAEAEAANRTKDEFLAMLGHELRNPLAPIATAIELMKLRGETHSTRERDVIERQLGHISRLVDDLLDVSRITRGTLDLALRPLDLADVVARAVEMASPLLEQRHHSLSLRVPRGLIVNADAARMAQIVSNLVTNAAKYTPHGGEIEVEATSQGADVVICVRDNGDGIAPDLLPRVFELFVQAKRTIARSEGGLGIGLALVKNLVTLHGGAVTATSELGKGSEFTVTLPRFAQVPAPRRTAQIAALLPAARSGKRVLVVDDNPDFAEMLVSTLSTLGYEVTMASDAVTALEQLREFQVEAAVLDLGLPVLDGFELARKIREEFPTNTPRLIAVTGYGQEHDRARTADVGFADHLVKPIDIRAMVAALERPNA